MFVPPSDSRCRGNLKGKRWTYGERRNREAKEGSVCVVRPSCYPVVPLSPTVPHGRLSTQTERKRGKRARQLPPARKVSDRRRIVIPSVRPSSLPIIPLFFPPPSPLPATPSNSEVVFARSPRQPASFPFTAPPSHFDLPPRRRFPVLFRERTLVKVSLGNQAGLAGGSCPLFLALCHCGL